MVIQQEGAWALDKAQPKEINFFLEVQVFHTQGVLHCNSSKCLKQTKNKGV